MTKKSIVVIVYVSVEIKQTAQRRERNKTRVGFSDITMQNIDFDFIPETLFYNNISIMIFDS